MFSFLATVILSLIFLESGLPSNQLSQEESSQTVEMVFKGSGPQSTKAFTVEDGWTIHWESDSPSFKLLVHGTAQRPYSGPINERDKVVQWFESVQPIVLANSTESTGQAVHPFGGTFYLKVLAEGSWILHLRTVKDTKDYLDVPYTAAP